jgi:glycosyltransferase involved in cell wall biosynthesis
MPTLSRDNKIIHGMWFGPRLSRLELLTLHSFTHYGHDFHLWAYDDLTRHDLPKGVVLRDAEEIISRKDVFSKSSRDRETGVGRNSFAAPFSDLFRYKLLLKHGGIWVDMDVTCLRPFAFSGEYAFRPHRIGVIGSILKSPPASPLMRRVYWETARSVGPESDYLLPNRILTKHVHNMGLNGFIVQDLSNPDHFMEYVRPLIEGPAEIPQEWYAIHWINEMWRTLGEDEGNYRGQRLLDYVPDKEVSCPHSVLWELYRKYGLIDRWEGPGRAILPPVKIGKKATPLPIRYLKDQVQMPKHLNVLLPSLLRGGAERSVAETLTSLQKLPALNQQLFVVYRSQRQYPISESDSLKVIFGDYAEGVPATMRTFAWQMLQASAPVVYTHLIAAELLKQLWAFGITTIPVVQNMSPGWNDPVSAFDDQHVPFIIGVSDAVSEELRRAGCKKAVITLRHELQRTFTTHGLARHRLEIRHRYGVADNTLLIGMVGQFKTQKAYTRAVRVLERVQKHISAKLMIVGGWDHNYGGGRAAFEATCRRAVELGVIADMIMPGDVHPVEPYLAALDVFLNTSLYEGLSIALLEAIATGCPVVTADAGGNREVLPPDSILVTEGSDIEAYAKGIIQLLHKNVRVLPAKPPDSTLVPRLWAMLARHGIANSLPRETTPSGTLFVTQNLQIGGAQKSLVSLLARLAADHKLAVCVIDGTPLGSHKRELDGAKVPIFSADGIESVVDQAEAILNTLDMLHVRNICFWNVAPELKLLLSKVLTAREIRLVDVSPGPMLFDEFEASAAFQQRISLTARQYFDRLDGFVAKYSGGSPPTSLCKDRSKLHTIPNAVTPPPSFLPLPPADALLPRHVDPNLAIGTCCRIVPDKKIEFLLDAMQMLQTRSPGTSLTIVGGPDHQSTTYFDGLRERVQRDGLRNVFFVGEHENVLPFLSQFQIFVLVSDRQGCPNASLEAMAMGLPIVAKRAAGIAEQVEDGVNGYLVANARQMVARIIALQMNKRLRKKMGQVGRAIALKCFSLDKMLESYSRLLAE